MNFIQKIIQEKKLREEQSFKRECSVSMDHVEIMIDRLKQSMNLFLNDKKSITQDEVDKLIFHITQTETTYFGFIRDLKKYKCVHDNTYSKDIKICLNKRIKYMQQKKKEYRAEFESIYRIFKQSSKGLGIDERNAILNKMLVAFDFDSVEYYKPVALK